MGLVIYSLLFGVDVGVVLFLLVLMFVVFLVINVELVLFTPVRR